MIFRVLEGTVRVTMLFGCSRVVRIQISKPTEKTDFVSSSHVESTNPPFERRAFPGNKYNVAAAAADDDEDDGKPRECHRENAAKQSRKIVVGLSTS